MSERRVVNTSTLIYLSRAGLLDLLRTADQPVIVPQAVFDEIMAASTADAAQNALRTLKWLSVQPSEPIAPPVFAWDLGLGESAVIAYAISHPGYTLVVDDLAARRCAATLALPVRGTLGLVLHAKKQGLLPSARSTLDRLRDAGMFLSDSVANAALREIRE